MTEKLICIKRLVRQRKSMLRLLAVGSLFLLIYLLLQDDYPRRPVDVSTMKQRRLPNIQTTSMEQTDVYPRIVDVSNNPGAVLYGNKMHTTGFLTIGIPTVKRPGGHHYLMQTLNSIFMNINETEKRSVRVVIYMADSDFDWNQSKAKEVYSAFKYLCDAGVMQIIHAPENIYSKLPHERPLASADSPMRVKWRAKQNIDFAYLLAYSRQLSMYYIQLEDDVECAAHFVENIRKTVRTTHNWICLEFSKLGFIGKLFKSRYLERIAFFFAANFDTQPCDILLGYVLRLLGQKKAIHTDKSFFQHIGRWSSLEGKHYPAIDPSFKDIGHKTLEILKTPKGNNPEAIIKTDMEEYPGYGAMHAYNGSSSYFLTRRAIEKNYFHVMFKSPANCSRIIISTGDDVKHNHVLETGMVYACFTQICDKKIQLKWFDEGEFDTQISKIILPRKIYGVYILIRRSQRMLIIREISIFLGKQIFEV